MKLFYTLPILSFCCSLTWASADDLEKEPVVSPSATQVAPTEPVKFLEELKTRAPKSLAEVKMLEKHVQDLVGKIRPATVSIFGGTGVVINKEGYILTAGHVLREPGRRTRIRFPSGKRAIAVTLGINDRYDSGLAKIVSDGDFPHLEMGNSSELKQGEWCLAVGFPVSFSRSEKPPVRLGRILLNRRVNITTDCTLMGGDSGGPLLNLDGKVIGINSRVSGGSLNRNVHVSVDVFKRDWDSLKEGEAYDKAGKLKPSPKKRGYLGINASRGSRAAVVGLVANDSAADKAGLKVGDLILRVAGKKIEAFSDVVNELSSTVAGDEITLKVRRGEQELELKVTLGKRP